MIFARKDILMLREKLSSMFGLELSPDDFIGKVKEVLPDMEIIDDPYAETPLSSVEALTTGLVKGIMINGNLDLLKEQIKGMEYFEDCLESDLKRIGEKDDRSGFDT
jgi:hypothetical protein